MSTKLDAPEILTEELIKQLYPRRVNNSLLNTIRAIRAGLSADFGEQATAGTVFQLDHVANKILDLPNNDTELVFAGEGPIGRQIRRTLALLGIANGDSIRVAQMLEEFSYQFIFPMIEVEATEDGAGSIEAMRLIQEDIFQMSKLLFNLRRHTEVDDAELDRAPMVNFNEGFYRSATLSKTNAEKQLVPAVTLQFTVTCDSDYASPLFYFPNSFEAIVRISEVGHFELHYVHPIEGQFKTNCLMYSNGFLTAMVNEFLAYTSTYMSDEIMLPEFHSSQVKRIFTLLTPEPEAAPAATPNTDIVHDVRV